MENDINENKALSQTSVSSSAFDDFFSLKEEIHEPVNMSKNEFVEKAKKLLAFIENSYGKGWQNRVLKDGEHPEESICDKCKGCGTFKLNEEDAECFIDHEQGECYVRYFDAEEFGLEVETCLDDIYELLFVDNVE